MSNSLQPNRTQFNAASVGPRLPSSTSRSSPIITLSKPLFVNGIRPPAPLRTRNRPPSWDYHPSRAVLRHRKVVKQSTSPLVTSCMTYDEECRTFLVARKVFFNRTKWKAPTLMIIRDFFALEDVSGSEIPGIRSHYSPNLSIVFSMSRNSSGRTSSQLSEKYIQDSFHSYLKSSLTQAKAERLLDVDVLASAEGDLMVTGPALCLYFAALRCTTNPPSVPLPRSSKSGGSQAMELSYDNCPPAFVSFLRVWANAVPSIQSLAPEAQHDLARVICGLELLMSETAPIIHGIAADLRAVAIEISQRRSFQDRYASDLQAALDAGVTPETLSPRKASFVPPPVYDATPRTSPNVSPRPSLESITPSLPPRPTHSVPPQSPGFLSPYSPQSSTSSFPPRSPSPSILTQDSPAIEFIRETLYASLADALERQPSLRSLLKRDPSRAYFASVAFAILDVSSTSITRDGSVIGVLGKPLTLAECPRELRPFMTELAAIGAQAKVMEEEDNQTAMRLAERGQDIPLSRVDRVKMMLEEGVGYERGLQEANNGRRSVEGRAVAFANRINALSLGMTKLRAFRERQGDVFKVLAGIGS
ncbi:hypothetical protein BDZ97DRAFT_1752921 [Flammula alnicola]|nr:hypothetical protein BDZ97DRAFT_1752921 [Flammula alnicola]